MQLCSNNEIVIRIILQPFSFYSTSNISNLCNLKIFYYPCAQTLIYIIIFPSQIFVKLFIEIEMVWRRKVGKSVCNIFFWHHNKVPVKICFTDVSSTLWEYIYRYFCCYFLCCLRKNVMYDFKTQIKHDTMLYINSCLSVCLLLTYIFFTLPFMFKNIATLSNENILYTDSWIIQGISVLHFFCFFFLSFLFFNSSGILGRVKCLSVYTYLYAYVCEIYYAFEP